ncbi:MAG: FAD-dependent oxidoreductase [Bacillota bacterium]|nr:FAD-dependent oxidoreductase [Bacillota bacterium]
MLRINQLRLPIDHSWEELVSKVKKLLRYDGTPQISIVRRSVDARKKPELYFSYVLNITVKNQKEVYRRCDKKQVMILDEVPYRFPAEQYTGAVRPVIIGTGPAGLFCGLMLAKAGFKPLLLERGKSVRERTEDIRKFWETGELNPESNVQFGEGGAGTFSDGKLNTLVKDKYGRNREVLRLFVEAGAPEEILYDHKPHIGTDILCTVIENIRHKIEAAGGSFRFQARVTDILIVNGQVRGVEINGEERLEASYVVLAPGHSARDTISMLYQKSCPIEAKPFAVGLRVEHPQKLINGSQYGSDENLILGNAPYKVTARAENGRGVYSFCMCPGGYVVNASSEAKRLAVNGMSYSKRDGKNANSAIIVSVSLQDYGSDHPLAGIEFQRRLEEKAYCLADGKVPVERYGDYRRAVLGEKQPADETDTAVISKDFAPCIKGEWEYAPVHEILPEELSEAFVDGMEQFGRVIKGFNDGNVLVEGIESRTSSPVRIVRDESLQTCFKGLYPCGEGAGYAGGITSAAMDGIHVAEMVAEHIIKAEEYSR